MRKWTTMLAALVALASPAAGQSQSDLLQIEIAAAKRAVSGGNIARSMITVEAAYAAPREAPGAPTGRTRPAERTRAIQEAVTVPSAYRRPYGETLLLMSEPRVTGDAAEVTATAFRVSQSGRRNFLTLQIALRREGGSWVVASCERIGGAGED